MSQLLVILMIVVGMGAWTQACPLGTNEEHLTIQRVMRNFGRFIVPAEMLVYRGQNKDDIITDSQLQEAIEKLSLVISCADAVLENPTGDMIPAAGQSLAGAAREEYMELFLFFMDEFKLRIVEYQSAFIKLQTQHQEERDFASLLKMTKHQDAFVERAHSKL